MVQQINWKDLEKDNTYDIKDWRIRVEKLASYIRCDVNSLMDLGCGECYVKNFLDTNVMYYPVDYVSRCENTIICDLNEYEFPDLSVDCVFISGCLEYVKDVDWLLDKVVKTAQKQIIISYTAFEFFPFEKIRREKAYQHDLLLEELIGKFYERGFILLKCENTTCALMNFERISLSNLIEQSWCINCGICSNYCETNIESFSFCPVIKCINAKRNIKQNWWTIGALGEEEKKCDVVLYTIAKLILEQDGIVFYSIYDSNQQEANYKEADHIEQIEEIKLNFLSKAKRKNYHNRIEVLLKSDRKVLFIGVACDIVCLKQYLEIKNINFEDRLICLEIQDDYLPSSNLFSEYLAEKGEIASEDSQYLSGLSKKLFINNPCENCIYKGKNYGDILIGNISKKGNYTIAFPTEAGKNIFNLLENKIQLEKSKETVKNPVIRKQENLLRDRFFYLKSRMPFEKALTYTLNKKWDIAYVGWYGIANYGAELTHYALYNFLRNNGYEVLMIQTPLSARRKPSKAPQLFRNNPYNSFDIAKIYKSKSEMYELNAFSSIFMIGSDQLWKKSSFELSDKIYDLEFVESNKLKIAYATSFGYEYYLGDEHDIACMKKNLQGFNAISVREKSGVNLCQNLFGIDVVRCMDPVFLCPKENYIKQAETSKRKFNNCIGAFFLDLLPEKFQLIEYLSNRLGKSYHIITDPKKQLSEYEPFIEKEVSVEDWIRMIIESDYIITDSMHASCLSIIFGKQFITVANEKGRVGSKDRIHSLFGILGLTGRTIEDCEDIKKIQSILESDIDYDPIYIKLEEEVEHSKKWLLHALNSKKMDITEDILLWERMIKNEYDLDKILQHIEELKIENKKLKSEIQNMKKNFFIRSEAWLRRKIRKRQ